MPSRELTYRITISSADARRQARNVRSVFEAELRTITLGRLDASALTRAVGEAQRLRQELEQAARASGQIQPQSGGAAATSGGGGGLNVPSGLAGGLISGVAITAAVQGIGQIGDALNDLSRRGAVFGQINDVLKSYAASANTTADAIVSAANKAAMGTISQYELMLNANRALQFEVAKTPEQFAKLVELSSALGRAQGISDTQSLEFLTTGLARESRLILDNLGLIINLDQATSRYAATLGKTADQLTSSERKAALLEEAYRQGATALEANRNASDSAATIFERLDANVQNAKDAFGDLFAELSKDYVSAFSNQIAEITNYFIILSKGAGASSDDLKTYLETMKADLATVGQTMRDVGKDDSTQTGLIIASDEAIDSLAKVSEAVNAGVPGADRYEQQIKQIVDALINGATSAPEAVSALRKVNADLAALTSDPATQQAMQANQAKAAAQAAAAEQARIIAEQSEIVNKALTARAQKSAVEVGAEAAIEQLRQQKVLAEQAIQALVSSGTMGTDEIAINVAAMIEQLTAPFDALEERAVSVDFSAIGSAFTSLNQSFVDFLPGIASARDELAVLSEELAYTGSMSAEQAAQFEYLSSVAYAVADSGSQLNGVVNELGTQFLSSNAYAAELVNQLFLAEAAFRNGQISAGQYAGMTAALTGNLLTLAQGAGIATNAIYALNQAQSDMSNLPGFAGGQQVGGSIAQRIQTQQAASGREQNRREMERYNAAVARQQETSARRAGKALEDGAKKASDALKNALDKVPGLFSTTSVTEQDVKDTEMGIYKEKADEYLRRLRDEVVNGKQWEDVSIEEARAGLERAGLEVGNTAEQTLALLEKAMNDSSLYSAAENIPIFINEEAVKYAQDLQNKSEQGRKNIYEYFGVQVDEAVSAATGGGGGAPAPVAPPKLVDIDPYTDGMQTGLDEYVDKNGQLIQEQIANAPGLMVDLDKLFAPGTALSVTTTGAMSMAAPASQMQPMSMNALASQKPGMAAQSLDITPTLPEDAAEKLALALGDQLSKQAAVFMSHGSSIGGNIINGLSAAMSLNAKGETQIDVAGFIAGNLSAQAATFIAQGTGIATLIGQGIDEGLAGAGSTATIAPTIHPAFVVAEVEKQNIISAVGAIVPTVNVALAVSAEAGTMTALVQSINTELRKIQPDIAREGATVSAMLTGGITASLSSTDTPLSIAQPLSTALITDIATNAALFATPGTVVAQLIMAAILAHMQGQQQGEGGGEGGGGPIAAALVTNLITQFATAAPQFTAAGIVPAQIVEAGFKGHTYTGMADNLQASVMQAIGSKAGEFVTAGSYIGGWIQQGINSAFTAEVNLSFAVNAGASWGTAFMKGALSAVGGGTLVQAISDKVITDLATEMEQP
jgi:hypothetical protein